MRNASHSASDWLWRKREQRDAQRQLEQRAAEAQVLQDRPAPRFLMGQQTNIGPIVGITWGRWDACWMYSVQTRRGEVDLKEAQISLKGTDHAEPPVQHHHPQAPTPATSAQAAFGHPQRFRAPRSAQPPGGALMAKKPFHVYLFEGDDAPTPSGGAPRSSCPPHTLGRVAPHTDTEKAQLLNVAEFVEQEAAAQDASPERQAYLDADVEALDAEREAYVDGFLDIDFTSDSSVDDEEAYERFVAEYGPQDDDDDEFIESALAVAEALTDQPSSTTAGALIVEQVRRAAEQKRAAEEARERAFWEQERQAKMEKRRAAAHRFVALLAQHGLPATPDMIDEFGQVRMGDYVVVASPMDGDSQQAVNGRFVAPKDILRLHLRNGAPEGDILVASDEFLVRDYDATFITPVYFDLTASAEETTAALAGAFEMADIFARRAAEVLERIKQKDENAAQEDDDDLSNDEDDVVSEDEPTKWQLLQRQIITARLLGAQRHADKAINKLALVVSQLVSIVHEAVGDEEPVYSLTDAGHQLAQEMIADEAPQQYEYRWLTQKLSDFATVKSSSAELNAACAEGWEVVNVVTLDDRYIGDLAVLLRRPVPPQPDPEPTPPKSPNGGGSAPTNDARKAMQDLTNRVGIGEAIKTHGLPAVREAMKELIVNKRKAEAITPEQFAERFPYTALVWEHGADAVNAAIDARHMQLAKAAFDAALGNQDDDDDDDLLALPEVIQ